MSIKTLGLLAASCMAISACMPVKEDAPSELKANVRHAGNPIIKDRFTADPAALVHDGRLYVYTGIDEAPDLKQGYIMNEWQVFSTDNMVDWTAHGSHMRTTDFKWANGSAWAAHTVEKDGKFYFYTTVFHKDIHGFAVGVGVSDSPTGPFKDAIGKALITNDMTTDAEIFWDDIDPAVFIDDDGQAYLYFGNTVPKYVKLKPNMIELDGPIHRIEGLDRFTEALYVHKHKDWYYMTYAWGFPEKTAYAMSRSPEGPWEYKGILNELAGNSNTNHQAVQHFKGKDYFIYHNGGLGPYDGHPESGGSFRRSLCIDELFYNEDGTIKRIIMTSEGVAEVE